MAGLPCGWNCPRHLVKQDSVLAAFVDESGGLAADAVLQINESERACRVENLQLAQIDLHRTAGRPDFAHFVEASPNSSQNRERPSPGDKNTRNADVRCGPAAGVKDLVKTYGGAIQHAYVQRPRQRRWLEITTKNVRNLPRSRAPGMKQCRHRGTYDTRKEPLGKCLATFPR